MADEPQEKSEEELMKDLSDGEEMPDGIVPHTDLPQEAD